MPPSAWETQWVIVAIVLAWFAFCAVLSMVGGWRELGERFASDAPIEGERFWFQSGSLGWPRLPLNYGGSLFATVGPRAFSLSMVFPLRFMHPRLVIPWSAVERCEPTRIMFMDYVVVHIPGFSRRLRLTGRLGRKVLETWSSFASGGPKSVDRHA